MKLAWPRIHRCPASIRPLALRAVYQGFLPTRCLSASLLVRIDGSMAARVWTIPLLLKSGNCSLRSNTWELKSNLERWFHGTTNLVACAHWEPVWFVRLSLLSRPPPDSTPLCHNTAATARFTPFSPSTSIESSWRKKRAPRSRNPIRVVRLEGLTSVGSLVTKRT